MSEKMESTAYPVPADLNSEFACAVRKEMMDNWLLRVEKGLTNLDKSVSWREADNERTRLNIVELMHQIKEFRMILRAVLLAWGVTLLLLIIAVFRKGA
jgi:hypothetical protein